MWLLSIIELWSCTYCSHSVIRYISSHLDSLKYIQLFKIQQSKSTKLFHCSNLSFSFVFLFLVLHSIFPSTNFSNILDSHVKSEVLTPRLKNMESRKKHERSKNDSIFVAILMHLKCTISYNNSKRISTIFFANWSVFYIIHTHTHTYIFFFNYYF